MRFILIVLSVFLAMMSWPGEEFACETDSECSDWYGGDGGPGGSDQHA